MCALHDHCRKRRRQAETPACADFRERCSEHPHYGRDATTHGRLLHGTALLSTDSEATGWISTPALGRFPERRAPAIARGIERCPPGARANRPASAERNPRRPATRRRPQRLSSPCWTIGPASPSSTRPGRPMRSSGGKAGGFAAQQRRGLADRRRRRSRRLAPRRGGETHPPDPLLPGRSAARARTLCTIAVAGPVVASGDGPHRPFHDRTGGAESPVRAGRRRRHALCR